MRRCTENEVKYTYTMRNSLERKTFYMYRETNHTNNCLKIICIIILRRQSDEKRAATAGSETDFSYLRGNRQTDGLTDFYHWASWINTTGYHLHSNAKQ